MGYLSLYRKYRSQTFSDLIGQDHVVARGDRPGQHRLDRAGQHGRPGQPQRGRVRAQHLDGPAVGLDKGDHRRADQRPVAGENGHAANDDQNGCCFVEQQPGPLILFQPILGKRVSFGDPATSDP